MCKDNVETAPMVERISVAIPMNAMVAVSRMARAHSSASGIEDHENVKLVSDVECTTAMFPSLRWSSFGPGPVFTKSSDRLLPSNREVVRWSLRGGNIWWRADNPDTK